MKVLTNIRLFITISLLFSLSVSGQHLRRKGSLGIAYVAASDSLMRSLRVLDTHGIVIQQIAPNSTAAQLGLQPNDVLVGINESDTLYEYDFLKATEQLYENDP
ncbi:MAG: PDZ domain-containing protein, partial [Runella slithyformis]